MRRWARPVITVTLLALCAAGLVLAFQGHQDEEPPVRHPVVVRVFPEANTLTLQQDAIGFELAFGWKGAFQLDGIDIPDDQIVVTPAINRVSFTPGEGSEVSAFAAGRHCAAAVYWRASETRETTGKRYSWCFNVA